MSRTNQEFKAEVLRRSEEYRRRRQQRRKKLMGTALCIALAMGGVWLVSPFFATGGSSQPVMNEAMEAPMAMEDAEYGTTVMPGAINAQSAAGTERMEEEPPALEQMVMIDGVIYMDTGCFKDDVRKCGMFDGKIRSTVAGSEMPTENDQSNFGIGYGYQYGGTEGTVEIYMDGIWRIFATEEVRFQE